MFTASRALTRTRALLGAAIARLPHGTGTINCWTGLGYGLGSTPWGMTGERSNAARSRTCARHPAAKWSHRTVIEASLRPHPLPPWLPAHRRSAQTLRALCRFFCAPSVLRLARVASLGLQHF
jgi:aldehyde dehydrogenase (NAD(P)+)